MRRCSLEAFLRPACGSWLLILTLMLPTVASSQSTVLPGTQVPTTKPANPGQEAEPVTPKPENIILETKDNVKLHCTYYGAPTSEDTPESGKSVVPFIVIHDWKGSRRQTFRFAEFLQAQGNAVIIPDLRGHGASTSVTGLDKPIDYETFKRAEMTSIILDIETCKKYLVQRNNEGLLNIDFLCVVAVGQMAPVATAWAIDDWFLYPPYNSEGIKQGQDVKALVLVGPEKKFGDYSLPQLARHTLFMDVRSVTLPLMLVWGEEHDESARAANAIYTALDKARPELPDSLTKEQKLKATSLFKAAIDGSSLSGSQLLESQAISGLWSYINNTVSNRIKLAADDHPWVNRDAAAAAANNGN